jgi:Lrp/AsnC family transcriptional regulator, leucine-responsive regulatory protein
MDIRCGFSYISVKSSLLSPKNVAFMKKKTILALDRTDIRLLQLVQNEGRMPIADLAKRVELSPSACARRLRLLEDGGVIQGYTARVNKAAVGLPMMALVVVTLNRKSEEALASFEAAISSAPEIMEAYLMTGRADYVLRVVVADLDAYERFLMRRLTRIPGVSQIESSFMLREVAARSALPVPAPDR